MIYFDNAATTMHKPETVIHAVAQALNSLGNAGRGAMRRPLMLPGIFMESENGLQIFSRRRPVADCLYIQFYREPEYCSERNPESGRPCGYYGSGA